MELVRVTIPQVVRVRGRAFRVRPPCVGEVLTLSATQPGAETEDRAVFLEVLRTWLPLRLYDVLRREPDPARLVHQLVGRFSPPPPEVEDTDDDEQADDEDVVATWESLLADYAMAYAVDPHAVWTSTPWGVFLAFLWQLVPAEARRQLRHLDWITYPHAAKGAEQIEQRMRRRARGEAPTADPTESRMMTDPEYRADKLRELEGFFG